MREVLIVAYLFPPLAGPGMQRTLGFVRHLPANGWRPTVICADGSSVNGYHTNGGFDPELIHRVPLEATVIRVAAGWTSKLASWTRAFVPRPARAAFDAVIAAPDTASPWGPQALQAALRIAERGRFGAIYSTGGPWANHVVAAAVRARTGLPWVADLHEPFGDGRRWPPRRIERFIYRRADRLVASSPGHMRALQARVGRTLDKVALIPDGYAESWFAQPRAPLAEREPLVLGWTGHESNVRAGPPLPIWPLLAAARRDAPSFRLRFIDAPAAAAQATAAGLGDICESLTPGTRSEMLDRLGECHATLLSIPATPRPSGMVPQALYLMLRAGRPMLAVLPPGDAEDLIFEAGDQHHVQDAESLDPTRAVHWLQQLAAEEVQGVPPDALVVQRHARDVLTQRLAGLLNDVAPASRMPGTHSAHQ